METVKSESGNTYAVRPSFKQKFPVFKVKEVIRETLAQQLGDVEYHIDHSSKLTSTLADAIKNNLKSLNLERYKLLVQVVIGQQKGEGVRMGTRCFWDAESDNYASDTYSNDSLFCVATAYGVYMY